MKKIKFLGMATIAAILATILSSSNGCPAVDPLDHTVLLPNEEDCGSFYMCIDGIPILHKCPEGLHFNPYLDVCDWPQNVDCKGTYIVVPLEEFQFVGEDVLNKCKYYNVYNVIDCWRGGNDACSSSKTFARFQRICL